MAITISIALQKGGVGKSTTAQALASTLGFKGYKTLLVDMDAQSNVTYSSGIDNTDTSVTDVLGGECKAADAVQSCKYYDIIPADSYLTNVEMTEDVEPTLLRDAIKPLKRQYDFIVIDTPPALGHLSINALTASDYVIIPTEPRPFALQGLGALDQTIKSVQKNTNHKLKVLGILLIKYNTRTVLNRQITEWIEETAKEMNTEVFNKTIREGIAVAEAQTERTPLIDYAKSSKPNVDYKGFTSEVLRKLGIIGDEDNG